MKNLLLFLIILLAPAHFYAQEQANHPIHAATFNGSNGFTVAGSDKEDLSGASVSEAGDINGDGYGDFLIGAYLADNGAITDAGKIYVVFGQGGAFNPLLNLSTLNGTNGFTINGKTENHQLGWHLSSAGDFNGDGFDDLLLGTPATTLDAKVNAGETYLIFGKATGYTPTFDLASLNGTNGFTIQGEEELDFFGYAVDGIGDINNDNFDDIIISAPFASPNQKSKAGIAYIIFGQNTTTPSLLPVANLNGTNGFRINGQTAYQFLGYSVSGAGNFDNDNFDDVLIGAYSADVSDKVDAGQSYLIYGQSAPYASTIELTSLTGPTGFAINGINAGDFSGWAVSEAGDVNKDGFGDILIGAPAASNPKEQAGEVYVLFGKTNRSTVFNLNTLNGNNGFTLKGIEIQDHVGAALSSVGDVNRDGIDDILIGAKNASPNGFASGTAYLFFGKENSFATSFNLSDLDGTNGLSILGKSKDYQLGAALSGLGDVDGDSFNDFIIGAKGANANGIASGESYVVTDIFACAVNAGFISTSNAVTNFSTCQGTDLMNDVQSSVVFTPSYGGLGNFELSAGLEYAMLLVNENNTILEIDVTPPYDFDFSTLLAGNYTLYGLAIEGNINEYLSTIQDDSNTNDLSQIRQDDNDVSSGGTGAGNLCLDLKNLGLNEEALQITIYPAPVIIANDIAVCIESSLQLTANSSDASLTYEWTNGDFASTQQNPVVTTAALPSNAGLYIVTASSNTFTCTTTEVVSVTVDSFPDITIPDSISVCIGETINLSATASRLADYRWTKPPSTVAIAANISNSQLSHQGIYQVVITDESGCEITETTEVFVNSLPIVTAQNINVSERDLIQLNAPSFTGAAYQWYGPSDFLSQLEDPIVTTSATLDHAGSYTLEVTDTNSCSGSTMITVAVSANPIDCNTANLSVETSNISIVEDEPIQLSASFAPSVTYEWIGPNNFTSTEQNPLVTVNATTNEIGNYTVTIRDENNCTASDVAQVNVEAFVFNCANAELEVEATDFVVQIGEPIQLIAVSATGLSYQWSGPNNFTSTQQKPLLTNSATLNDAGNYLVEVTDQNNCTETDLAIIQISGTSVTCVDDVTVSANPANNAMVMAKKTITTNGNVIIGNNKNVIFQAGENITLSVGFSVVAGSTFSGIIADCAAGNALSEEGTTDLFPNKEVGLTEKLRVTNEPSMQVFPNPFRNQTQIAYHLVESSFVQLTLYDLQGAKKKTIVQAPTASAGHYTIDLQNNFLTEGFYLLVLTTKQGIQTKKLVVLK